METILERLKKCKSFSQACKEFNYSINGYGMDKIKKLALEVNFDIRMFDERYVYSLNIKKCKNCSNNLDFLKRTYDYCSSSCAAKVNNVNRECSEETKEKLRQSAKIHSSFMNSETLTGAAAKCKLIYNICIICSKLFTTRNKCRNKKTCSRECQTASIFINRTYQNGSRLSIEYFNKIQGNIILESSWELKIAEILDNKNINWVRPNPISWIDFDNKSRLYYPDFYLKDYDVYLDPKNSYCMEKDKYKMKFISEKVNIVYGELDKIIDYVSSLN